MTGELAAALVLDVPPSRSEIRSARPAVVAHLTHHAVPTVIVDDFELVTSELVTNAVIHAPASAPVRLELAVWDDVVLAVSNIGSADAIPPIEEWQLAPALPVSGRGLGIVRRLCDEVHVEQRGDRAAVVCRRRLPDGGAAP